MRKLTTTIAMALLVLAASGQTTPLFIRHDTLVLRSSECEWAVQSLIKKDSSLIKNNGKSVPEIILNAVQQERLKAIDINSNSQIPASKIYTWHMPADTMVQIDPNDKTTYTVIQGKVDPNKIKQVRVYQDWYFDVNSSRFYSIIKWIDLISEVYTQDGTFRGYTVFCRIYY
jgi:hypothetical protein